MIEKDFSKKLFMVCSECGLKYCEGHIACFNGVWVCILCYTKKAFTHGLVSNSGNFRRLDGYSYPDY